MSYLADDTQAIAARMKELQAEKDEAVKGSSAPVQEQKDETPIGYGDYLVWNASQPLTGYKLRSLSHPNWPYANTGFEWRRFVRS